MFFFEQFEKFDPVSGNVLEHPFTHLPEIAARSRSLLSGWTTDRMVKAAKRINDEVETYFHDLKTEAVENLRIRMREEPWEVERFFEFSGNNQYDGRWDYRDDMDEELAIPTPENTSEVDALKTIIEDRDSCYFLPEGAPEPEVEHWSEGKTYELFAVLSLWQIADAISWSKNRSENSLSIAGEYALKAMDSVCHAEHLREVDWLVQRQKEDFLEFSRSKNEASKELASLISERFEKEQAARKKAERTATSTRLNVARHAKRNAAMAKACEEWWRNPGKYSSFEKAGADLADWIVNEELLKKVEPRTVSEWIRKYAKTKKFRYRKAASAGDCTSI